MSSNYYYSKLPGARLEIGPGGQLEEGLGACCASCARGGLGATATAQQLTSVPPSSSIPLYVAAAGVGVLGLVLYLRRRSRRR